ncbi:Arm DNA-binding domain-containing protein [Pseudomonas sp. HR96]|uniref:Arm DNA-binding domain-containing protein n=1 Tax=Pseudomonas sp. HR96 TaxID=1027966 RepID=UPI0039BE3952
MLGNVPPVDTGAWMGGYFTLRVLDTLACYPAAGRGSSGISDSSIEITFIYRGVRCRERITLKPTATNLKKAEQYKAAIEHAISIGTFDYSVAFPGSARLLRSRQRQAGKR